MFHLFLGAALSWPFHLVADPPTPQLKVIQDWAVREELMDPRERRYVLVREEDFAGDTKLIYDRWRRLRHAPRVSTSLRFPERHYVND
jgi:hypothetical protein